MARRKDPWAGLAWNAWAMGLEASTVIGLRTMKIAAGGAAAQAEIDLMVGEKMTAAMTLPMLAMTGQLGTNGPAVAAGSISHLRKKVRANRRRLSKA
ncbi:MAG: hypothetical protein B7Y78_06980 [Caulobacter sp. 35-67-4]|jgi:hypothetical protein|nr:MAG: hypothetical protein B7Y81_15260 [Caulobacter sp. 32-67-35]OYX94273.1 MAG: hypothetical protein B7Y78_06980 [Caulobacter sp. 35-67-4]OZA77561.1 MAG: hypothetical protein B7X77_04485 [Caulobacter sp. 39-67-4]HQR89975.1 hypothetical protein [Caulobacter sp.]